MPQTENPLPVFIVTISCSRLLSGQQHNTLDNLVTWSAAMTPEGGLKLVDNITTVLNETLPGAMAARSEGGAKALESLGQYEQLPLLACPVTPPDDTSK